MSERRLGLTVNSSFPCLFAMRALAVSTSRIVRPRRSREVRRFRPATTMATVLSAVGSACIYKSMSQLLSLCFEPGKYPFSKPRSAAKLNQNFTLDSSILVHLLSPTQDGHSNSACETGQDLVTRKDSYCCSLLIRGRPAFVGLCVSLNSFLVLEHEAHNYPLLRRALIPRRRQNHRLQGPGKHQHTPSGNCPTSR